MKYFALFCLILFFIFASCSGCQGEIGKYVYVDSYNAIHIDRECASSLLKDAKTKDERMAIREGIEFIDTCKLVNNPRWPYRFCPKCIDDDTFQHISSMMKRNEKNFK